MNQVQNSIKHVKGKHLNFAQRLHWFQKPKRQGPDVFGGEKDSVSYDFCAPR